MTVDMATMFGMLELSAGRACAVNQTLYVYNMANHLNDMILPLQLFQNCSLLITPLNILPQHIQPV